MSIITFRPYKGPTLEIPNVFFLKMFQSTPAPHHICVWAVNAIYGLRPNPIKTLAKLDYHKGLQEPMTPHPLYKRSTTEWPQP